MPQIKDRIYYISGGASGLGLATARLLHSKGAYVALLDLNEERGQEVEAAFKERALFCECDVTETQAIEKAIQKVESKWPQIKTAGVLNAGGIGWAEPIVSASGDPADYESFKHVVNVNLNGSFNLSRMIASRIVKQYPKVTKRKDLYSLPKDESIPDEVPGAVHEDRGCIIFVSSVAFEDGQNGQAAYTASKAGVAQMTLPLARDLARFGIRCLAIAPGVFSKTNMGSLMPRHVKANLLNNSVFPARSGNDEEFAQLVVSMLENQMLNGTTIRLDGAARMNKL